MSGNKIDRASLRRQAQRVESYTSLLSKRKRILKNINHSSDIRKLRSDCNIQKYYKIFQSNNEGIEDFERSKENTPDNCLSPSSSVRSSSSDSSQEYQPDNRIISLKPKLSNLYQKELELRSVVTRSTSRKYASVGAFYNKVDLDRELRVVKRWPVNVSYPIHSTPSSSDSFLKEVVTKSLNEVVNFCKCIGKLNQQSLQERHETLPFAKELPKVIDLSPYLTQEPVIINGTDETQITLHLNDHFISHQLLNLISDDEGQSGTVVIQEENEHYNTITLHSETPLLGNEYFPDKSSTDLTMQIDPMLAVLNDHTYAQKHMQTYAQSNKNRVTSLQTANQDNQSEFKEALSKLLLNTIELKCLLCGDTPQEMISFLENSKKN